MQPLIFRQRTIEKLAELDIPETATIIEYRVSINPFTSFRNSCGVRRLYSKIKIDRDVFEKWTKNHIDDGIELLDGLKRFKYDYSSLNIDNVEELWISDIMGSKLTFFTGTTGIVYTIITKETEGRYFMYVIFE